MNIVDLGGGRSINAITIHLAGNGHIIHIWEFVKEYADEMQQKRVCRLLPEVNLPGNIMISNSLPDVLRKAEVILVVVPSDKVEATIENAVPFLQRQPLVLCSKGFAANACLLSDVIGKKVSQEVYALYGPTHAEEVCKGMFSGIVLAGGKGKEKIKWIFESEKLKVELSDDIIGAQVAAALKNVLAVFIGVLDGAGLGDNAKAYIMTKGLEEIQAVGVKLGAKKETFYGLAGLGDVIVTCTSKHSRNRFVGQEVGKGRKLDDVLREMKMVAEGVNTVKEAMMLQKKVKLSLPLISGLHQILFEGKDVQEVLKKL